jgi:formiminotetrahydrofolate cyclodeaminase
VTTGDPGLEIEGALEGLGSPAHPAASGSATALSGALAAAVVAKVTRASERPGAAAQAALLQKRLAELAELDAQALRAARLLLATGAGGCDFELGEALRKAMSIPAWIGVTCADVALLAAGEHDSVLADHRPDLQAAATLAAGAANAAAQLVAVNLAATPDDPEVVSARTAAAAAADVVAAFGAA